MVSCSLTFLQLKACWKSENSHGRFCKNFSKGGGNIITLFRKYKFFQGRRHRYHMTYIFQIADIAMQIDVHKSVCCFYTIKKMHHESTCSICIYFEIFFQWSCIRVCHKNVLSVICCSVCWIGTKISLLLLTPPWVLEGGARPPGLWKFHKKGCFFSFE